MVVCPTNSKTCPDDLANKEAFYKQFYKRVYRGGDIDSDYNLAACYNCVYLPGRFGMGSFPVVLSMKLEKKIGKLVCGMIRKSGTIILQMTYRRHIKRKKNPIVKTSTRAS